MRFQRCGIVLLAAVVAAVCLAPDAAEARPRQRKVQPWHGWSGDSFYLDGVRYRGGNRRGPATAYNNWEGGFNPEAFWVLHQRNVSGV
jgi:hypothetical protein